MGTPCGLVEMGRGGLHMDGWFPLGGLHVNGSFVCVGLRGKIWWRWVGAVPVCPPASPSCRRSVPSVLLFKFFSRKGEKNTEIALI